MTEFKVRTRVKEARAKIRDASALRDEEPVAATLTMLFEDLAADLARYRPDDPHAFRFIMDCMAAASLPAAAAPPAPAWKWPIINNAPPGVAPASLDGGVFSEFSALKMFGYTVGKTKGWPKADRQAFLHDFMAMPLPPIVKSTFGGEYGEPLSTDRLRKVANVIANNASLRSRNDPKRYAAAIADWEADLAYLKREFYEGKGLKFQPWPSSR